MTYRFNDLILRTTHPDANTDLSPDTMLAAVSPVLLHDLNPSSSYRPHSPSVSSSSTISLSQDLDFDPEMAFQGDEEAARRLMFPSSNPIYYSQTSSMPSQQVPYQPAQLPNSESWMSVPIFAEHQSSYNSAFTPSGIYQPYDSAIFPPGGGVIPPTPQTTEAPQFYNPLPSQPHVLLNPTPSHTTSYSSRDSNHTSISSSLSRSCSPAQLTCTAPANDFTRSLSTSAYGKNLVSTPQSVEAALSTTSQSQSQSNSNSLHAYGLPIPTSSPSQPQTWRCAYPNCSSRALFTRGCDLRKHFNRHSKHLFCRIKGCPQSAPKYLDPSSSSSSSGNSSQAMFGARNGGIGMGGLITTGGFSSKKDRARHEAKHNPRILCEWVGEGGERCGRRFSRVDNMKDHMRRIHRKGQPEQGGSNPDGAAADAGEVREPLAQREAGGKRAAVRL